MPYAFDAYVAAVLFPREGAAFCLGDGAVRFEGGESVEAHDGGVLCAAVHPSGSGVLTGGDDGKLVWSRPSGAEILADAKGKWIDAVAASAETGLIAYAAGKLVTVLDSADPSFSRGLVHERSVAGLDFDPKGRRLACATYGGAALWFARIAEQKPAMLKWPGAHIGVMWSPDGRFLVSAMQENDLHGWRIADAKDMRMSGYSSKVRSMVFLSGGRIMATSGAEGAVLWSFGGSNGPMGQQAIEIGHDQAALVARVAAAPLSSERLVAGLDDGRVWTAELAGKGLTALKAEKGPPITALSVSPDGKRAAWGDEGGGAGVAVLP